MSGGSYNYLCHGEVNDILAGKFDEELEHMTQRLCEVCPEAAQLTEQLIQSLKASRLRVGARVEFLRDVWYAVEWRDSGDYGDDSLKEAIEAWRKK